MQVQSRPLLGQCGDISSASKRAFNADTLGQNLSRSIEELKSNNQRPSPEQVQTLQSVISQRSSDMRYLDQQIHCLLLQIDSLANKVKALHAQWTEKERELNYYRSFLSPIRVLPAEVLGKIFNECVVRPIWPSQVSAPLNISHVCTSWRNVAFGVSGLWDSISIKRNKSQEENGSLAQLMKFWFNNARSRPLSLSFYSKISGSWPWLDDRMIKSHFSHICELYLDVWSLNDLYSLLALPKRHFPLLEVLTLRTSFSKGFLEPLIAFDSTPRLHSVTLKLDHTVVCNLLHLPWSQLTHLDIKKRLPCDAWYDIFHLCLRLQSCAFVIIFPFNGLDVSQTEPPVHFVDLIHLRLTFVGGGNPLLFQHLHFPALKAFELSGDSDFPFPMNFDDYLFSMLTQSSLCSLVLRSVDISTRALLELLHYLPTLEKLALDVDFNENQLSVYLTDTGPQNDEAVSIPPLPNLTSLLIAADSHTTEFRDAFLPSLFVEMVKSRSEQQCRCAKFKNLSLFFYADDPPEDGEDDLDIDLTGEDLVEEIQFSLARIFPKSEGDGKTPRFTTQVITSIFELTSIMTDQGW